MDAGTAHEPYRYDAFISYRHTPEDRAWARWLHGALETWRTPGRLVHDLGVEPRLKRVFRDEEELEASAHLSVEIENAIRDSRYLVVVCSPRTPASRWVNEEILRFRALGRNDRILALLIEGEPMEAFPPALREIRREVMEDQGPVRETVESVEPLAADVRPSSEDPPRTVRRMAKLRLLAVILGCRFDDLRQREQERRLRRATRIGAVLVGLLVLVAGLAGVAVHQRGEAVRNQEVAEEATAQATEERSRAQDLSRFTVFEMRDELAKLGRIDLLAKPALKMRDYYASLAARHTSDEELGTSAAALNNVGQVLAQMGRLEDAEKGHRDALAIQMRLLESAPSDPARRYALSASHTFLGHALMEQGRLSEAEQHYAQSLALRSALAAESPAWSRDLSLVHTALGKLRHAQGDLDAARDHLERALELDKQRAATASDEGHTQHDVLIVHGWLGEVAAASGDHARAVTHQIKAVEIATALVAEHGEDFRYHSALAHAHESLSGLYRQSVRTADAERHLDLAWSIRELLAERDPANVAWQHALAANLSKRGDLRRAEGVGRQALENFGAAARIFARLASHDPISTLYPYHLALLEERAAQVHATLGEHRRALDLARRARQRLSDLVRRDPTQAEWARALATVTLAVGDARVALDEIDEAQAAYREALTLHRQEASRASEHDDTQHNLALVLARIADVHLERGRAAEAVELYDDAVKVYERLVRKAPEDRARRRDLGLALTSLGDALHDHGDVPGARSRYGSSIDLLEGVNASGPPRAMWQRDLTVSLDRLAGLLLDEGELEEALERRRAALASQQKAAALDADCAAELDYLRDALRTLELRMGARPPESAADHLVVAYARFEAKAHSEATAAFEAALRDPDVRDDLERGHLYNAACAAARAGEAATGADAERLASQALGWLGSDLSLRRARLSALEHSAMTPEQRAAAREQVRRDLAWARNEDPDLASLRERPAFRALFEEDGAE